MSKIIMKDGWDIEEYAPLYDVISNIEKLETLAYELRNCVRTMSLQEMKEELLGCVDGIINACNDIEDDDVIVEEDDEE